MKRSFKLAILVGAAFVVTSVNASEPKVTICHHTGSETNPLVMIEVSASALPAHLAHGDQSVDGVQVFGCFN